MTAKGGAIIAMTDDSGMGTIVPFALDRLGSS